MQNFSQPTKYYSRIKSSLKHMHESVKAWFMYLTHKRKTNYPTNSDVSLISYLLSIFVYKIMQQND